MERLTLFIYRMKGARCNPSTLYDHLHGYRAIRSTKDFGRAFRKTYEYPGIPHRDIIPGVIAVEPRHERRAVEVFEKYRVPYIRARVKKRKKNKGR